MAGEMVSLAKTPLGQAIRAGDVRRVKTLAKDHDTLMFTDRKDNNYLHYVCTMYRPYVFHILASSGLDLNALNRHGHTPLHITAIQHEACHVPDLMLYGVNPYIKNKNGLLAKELTRDRRWHTYYKAFEPGLRQAIVQHDIVRVEELLKSWSSCHIVVDGKEVRHLAAGLGYYDIVALIDKYRFSILAAYSVMESNYWWLKYAISRDADCEVNTLQTVRGRKPIHMLTHAIRLKDQKLINLLLEGGANVNMPVYVNDFVLAPLYYEAICFHSQCDKRLLESLLDDGADLALRDERGRSALTYAIDRRNGKCTVELVENLMERGVNIAMRDNTGCTAREIALLARRKDIVQVIDKYIISLVKDSQIDTLWELVVDGYRDIIINFQYRDTWIYAAGNENEDTTVFLDEMITFQKNVQDMHYYIVNGDLTKMQDILLENEQPHRLLFYRDKGGRGALLKALMYRQWEVAEYILIAAPFITDREMDSHNRTALHYATASGEEGTRIVNMLLKLGANRHQKDVLGLTPKELFEMSPDFLRSEQEMVFGLEMELHCIKRYEEMLQVIRSRRKTLKHFDKILKQVNFPISEFPRMFEPEGKSLASDYRDLLLCSIDNKKEGIARKLLNLGVDSFRKELYPVKDGSGEKVIPMDSLERANHLGLSEMAEYIKYKRKKVSERPELYDKSLIALVRTHIRTAPRRELTSETVVIQ